MKMAGDVLANHLTSSTLGVMLDMNTMIETTNIHDNDIYSFGTNMSTTTTTTPAPTTVSTTIPSTLVTDVIEIASSAIPNGLSDAIYPSSMLGFTGACAFILAILGFGGNLITIIALSVSKKLRSKTATAFVINLAVVEMLFCILILPMSGAQYVYLLYTNEPLLSDSACSAFTYIRYSLTQIELQTILGVALTRALAVSCTSLFSRIDNPSLIKAYIILIWVYAIALKLPTALGYWGKFAFNKNTMECDLGTDEESEAARQIHIIIEALIPVLSIIILYVFIFFMVMRQSYIRRKKLQAKPVPSNVEVDDISTPWLCCCLVKLSSRRVFRATMRSEKIEAANRKLSESDEGQKKPSTPSVSGLKRALREGSIKSHVSRKGSCSHRSATCRRDMRVARTIFIIFMMILICSVPVAVMHKRNRPRESPNLFLAIHILYWLQYCLNLIVYVLLNRQYRDAYIDLLTQMFPSFEAKKGFRFSWEKQSIYSKPLQRQKSGIKACKSNGHADNEKEVQENGEPQRNLSAIPEGTISKSGDDDVFYDIPKVPSSDKIKSQESPNSDVIEPLLNKQTNLETEHWVTENGISNRPNQKEDLV